MFDPRTALTDSIVAKAVRQKYELSEDYSAACITQTQHGYRLRDTSQKTYGISFGELSDYVEATNENKTESVPESSPLPNTRDIGDVFAKLPDCVTAELASLRVSEHLGKKVQVTNAFGEGALITRFSCISLCAPKQAPNAVTWQDLGDLQNAIVFSDAGFYIPTNSLSYVRVFVNAEGVCTIRRIPVGHVSVLETACREEEHPVKEAFKALAPKIRSFKLDLVDDDSFAHEVIHYLVRVWSTCDTLKDMPLMNILGAAVGRKKLRRMCKDWPEYKALMQELEETLRRYASPVAESDIEDVLDEESPDLDGAAIKNSTYSTFSQIPLGCAVFQNEDLKVFIKTGRRTIVGADGQRRKSDLTQKWLYTYLGDTL